MKLIATIQVMLALGVAIVASVSVFIDTLKKE